MTIPIPSGRTTTIRFFGSSPSDAARFGPSTPMTPTSDSAAARWISGRLTSRLGRYAGTLRVSAPRGLGGRVTFDRRRGLTGVLGGRRWNRSAFLGKKGEVLRH